MDIAANAVIDMAAPPPAQATAAPRDDDGPRFQDHLDTDTPRLRDQDQGEDTRPIRQQTKAQSNDQAESASASTATNDSSVPDKPQKTSTNPTTSPEPRAHAVLLQVLADASAAEPTATPPAPTVQQQQQKPAPAKHQATASAPAAPNAAPAPPGAETATPKLQKLTPNKTDPKGEAHVRASDKAASEKGSMVEAPAAAQTATVTPPTPTAAPLPTQPQPQPSVSIAAGKSSVPQHEAIATAHLDGPRGAPQPHAPPSQTPVTQSAEPPAQKPARISKMAETVAAAMAKGKASAANLPAFKDFGRLASGGGSDATPTSATLSTSAAPSTLFAAQTPQDPLALGARAAPVAAQVAREIVRRANGDSTRFELRLDPPELGRIQVRLDVSRDHKVTAVVSADNPQALSDLSRGARDLQQALQSAGLDLPDDGLSFDLSNRQGGFSQPDQSNTGNPGGSPTHSAPAELQSSTDTATPRARVSIESWRGARIDVMA